MTFLLYSFFYPKCYHNIIIKTASRLICHFSYAKQKKNFESTKVLYNNSFSRCVHIMINR